MIEDRRQGMDWEGPGGIAAPAARLAFTTDNHHSAIDSDYFCA
jgi:hypothetical protein